MAETLAKLVQYPGAGELASVRLRPFRHPQNGLQNGKPFRPFSGQRGDRLERLLFIHTDQRFPSSII